MAIAPTSKPLRLSRLRDIAWAEWDPIHILRPGEVWDHQPFADEYDSYILSLAAEMRRGLSDEEGAKYLMDVETGTMGLTTASTSRIRAQNTVRAVRSYLSEVDHQTTL